MPTAHRPDWVANAIGMVQRQDYERWQLVIVDDEHRHDLDHLVANTPDPRIVHLKVPRGSSVGRKLNVGFDHATGDLLTPWNDDDWYGPGRLTSQLAPILAGAADLTALRDALWFDVRTWTFTAPHAALHRQIFPCDVHSGTVMLGRSVWEAGYRFTDSSLAEDATLLTSAVHAGYRLSALPATGVFMHVRHDANTWRVLAGDGRPRSGWSFVSEPPELLAERPFYSSLAGEHRMTSLRIPGRPVASCIMPTADRRAFVPTAIGCFLAQTYEPCELIIVDDGVDPVADLLPADPRVRYVRLDRKTVLGTKRNIAVENSEGDIIVHWDDDDWSHPERVEKQVESLLGPVDLCGLDEELWWNPATGRAWRYSCAGPRAWVAGNTFAYRRSVWQRNPFRPKAIGEDTAFAFGPTRLAIHAVDDLRLVVGTIHDDNTARKDTTDRTWTPARLDEVRSIIDSGSDPTITRRR